MNEFFDRNKYYLKEIRKEVAKDMIVKHHYSHSWTSCDFTLGVFEKTETVHNFFDIFFISLYTNYAIIVKTFTCISK